MDLEEQKKIQILLVEDSPGDQRLTKEALKEGKIHCELDIVDNGEKAMKYLLNETEYADKPRPDLVLLDLNLPIKDGREVLKEIKEHPSLKTIPIVVLTTSKAEEDLIKTYENHVNCYITKPVDLDQFLRVIRSIEDFWLSIVKLPPKN